MANNYKTIQLTKGKEMIVDSELYRFLNLVKWHCDSKGYARKSYKENNKWRGIHAHRLIVDAPIGMMVDHINGNPLDNRLCNLRIVTPAQNSMNVGKTSKNTSSKYKGVTRVVSGKWQAVLNIGYERLYLGVFPTQTEAALAYNEAAKKHHVRYARLNIIPQEEIDALRVSRITGEDI
jgi:hypothetical protein